MLLGVIRVLLFARHGAAVNLFDPCRDDTLLDGRTARESPAVIYWMYSVFPTGKSVVVQFRQSLRSATCHVCHSEATGRRISWSVWRLARFFACAVLRLRMTSSLRFFQTEPILANLLSCVLCLLLIADGKELTVVRRQRMSSFSTRIVVLTLIVGGWILCSSLTLLAREAGRMPKERVSFIAEATTTVLLRRRPPNLGYLFIAGPGNGIGLLEKGERVK